MPAPLNGEGGNITSDIQAEFAEKFKVYLEPQVLTEPLLHLAAQSAQSLHKAVRRHGLGIDEDAPVSVQESRLTFIKWGEEDTDRRLAQEIQTLTDTDVTHVLKAGRYLLKAGGYSFTPQILAVFRSNQAGSLGLHRDGEKKNTDFIPNPNWRRYWLNLRGPRVVGFANDEGELGVVRLKPGDFYALLPGAVYHCVDYVDDSLALYVQSQV